jgi:predicted PurR-regulated permease PerM
MTDPVPDHAEIRAAPSSGSRPRGSERSPVLRQLRPLIILAGLALVFACLRLAREVLIPVAFAMLLALVLTPLVAAVQRRGLHRIAAVVLVVFLVFSALGALGWMFAQQVNALANDLPRYRHNIRQKVADIRLLGRGGSIEKVQETVKDVEEEMKKSDPSPAARRPPIAVVSADKPLWQLPSTLGAIAEIIATTGLVIVLVVFMLVERQQLRNRLVRLFGHGKITITTKALDEATQGISRYLLMYTIVNTCFGLAVAGGLWLLAVPYPVLWGALAAILRFIPYVGTWMAALLPIAMSLAVFPGWTKPLLVIALFLILEPFIYAVVEPLLYGHSIGVSQTALLVALAFWTWLWGPLGLILATPLTVCLVVLGKYVPELDFLTTLMSDKPVLTPDLAYYQRLVAMDQDEAADIVEAQLPALGPARIYDEVMVPALAYARRDRARGRLGEAEAAFVAHATREILEGTLGSPVALAESAPRARIVGWAARDEADEVALRMLGDLLAESAIALDVISADMLTGEVLSIVEAAQPSCICVAALPPGGVAHARYLVKRLRARFPEVRIVVGRWGCKDDLAEDPASLLSAGADRVSTTLTDARDQVEQLLPLAPQRLARSA